MGIRIGMYEEVSAAIERVMQETACKGIHALRSSRNRHIAIHEARKRLKKIRAIIRIVRPVLGKQRFKEENTYYRDLGRTMSAARDAQALIETTDMIRSRFDKTVYSTVFDGIREALLKNRRRVMRKEQATELIANAAATLEERKNAIDGLLILEGLTITDLAEGYAKVYKRGYRASLTCSDTENVEEWHNWRKRVKYLRMQTKIIENAWPRLFKAFRKELDELSDHLGDDHDLAILNSILTGGDYGIAPELQKTFLALLEKEQEVLKKKALKIGRRIFEEDPSVFKNRIMAYLEIWKKEKSTACK